MTSVIKLSFLLQYRRFLIGKWTTRLIDWSAIVLLPLLTIINVTLTGVSCLPIAIIIPSVRALRAVPSSGRVSTVYLGCVILVESIC